MYTIYKGYDNIKQPNTHTHRERISIDHHHIMYMYINALDYNIDPV